MVFQFAIRMTFHRDGREMWRKRDGKTTSRKWLYLVKYENLYRKLNPGKMILH